MSNRFEGKVAVVTGASRGIGLGIAERLVAEGAKVCITARKQEALDDAVTALGGPDHAIAVAGKADDIEHQRDAIRATIEAFGSVDLLVNNAGINPVYGPLVDLDLHTARKIVEVNALAALSWVQHVHRAWMGEHSGSVVNVSSVAGLKPAPGIGFYGASKAMLSHITRNWRSSSAQAFALGGAESSTSRACPRWATAARPTTPPRKPASRDSPRPWRSSSASSGSP
jgi:NADP-dependent 3-hydroxy acid dehydrogenase YdfG